MAQQVVISFNANANFSDLIGEIKRANAEIGVLQNQLQGLGSSSFGSLDILNKQFIEGMKNSRMWSSSFVDVTNETREFGKHLDQGRLKLKDYFREFNTQVKGQRGMIRKLAEEQVRLQRSVLTTTVGPQGQTRNVLSTPTGLDGLDPATMKALKSETFKIIGKSIQGVSTELINLGKNTQWAGRQLTVGLTVPLTMFAASAATAFKEVDKQLTRLAKVYGDIGGATSGEIAAIRAQTTELARTLAADLGAPMQDTIGLAADIAATGKTGDDLLKSVAETTRLAVLGEVDRQAAMSATLSLQNAFNLSTQELGESINFLNAVENQTSTSLEDLVIAIPKAGPVVKSLGGDVKDLALFLTAMKEGGINASEGANALKSGLASIINPTKQTTEVMNNFGIDIQGLVNKNAGDLVGTVQALQIALSKLDPLSKSKAIEQLFGKFQFARMSALFDNLGASGSQTLQVMDLMKASTVELANVADRELSVLTESASGKFARQLESFKANMAGVGEGFLGIFSGVLGVLNKLLDGFNRLPDGIKNIMTILGVVVGLAGPLIMLSGVFLNFFGYLTKAAGFMGRLFTGTKGFELLNEKVMASKLSTDSMSNSFYDQARATEVARMEIDRLIRSITELMSVQETAATGAAMAGGSGKFAPQAMFQSRGGFMPGGSEFSHYVNEGGRKRMSTELGISSKDVGNLGTLGTYVAQSSPAAALQRAMGEAMPTTIAPAGTSEQDLRKIIAEAANTPVRKAALSGTSGADIKSLFSTPEEYAQYSAQHVANMKVISEAYGKSVADGKMVAKAIQESWKNGGPDAAIATARQFGVQLGVEYDQVVEQTKNEILTAINTDGVDAGISAAAKAEVKASTKLIDSAIADKTKKSLFRMSSSVSQAAQAGEAQMAAATADVSASVDNLRNAEKRLAADVSNDIDMLAAEVNSGIDGPPVTGGGRFSRVKGAFSKQGIKGLMKPGMGSSMAMMGLGMGASMMPTGGNGALNTAGNIAGGAMMGASMGMMFGPIGAGVGAALGAIIPAATALWKALDKLRDIASLTARQYEIDKEYAKAAGINLKTIGDIQLTQLTGKSAEAASALDILSKAALEASTNTTTGALREKTKGADSFDVVKKDFESQYLSYLASGVPEETARVMMAAILKAAGKEEFSTDLNMTLNKYKGQTSSEATATSLKRAAEGTVAGTRYQGVADRAESFGLTESFAKNMAAYSDEQLKSFKYTEEQIKYVRDLQSAYAELDEKQKQIADSNLFYGTTVQTAQAVDILSNAIANQDMATFADSMSKASAAGNITKDVVNGVQASIKGLSKSENTVLDKLQSNGVDSADVMLALKMRVEGVITSLEEVNGFDGMKIRATFELYQANQALDKAKADLKSSLEGMFAGGSTAPNNEAAKKAIQAQLDALDEIARKEGNINKIKELQLKYEEKRRSLALDYLGALSSGDMEGALRAQLEMQAESARFLEEKAKTEKEIARDDQKKALQDKLKNLDSASGAVKNTANKAKELQTNIDNAINSMMEGFKKNGKIGMSMDEFIKSPEYTNFESKFKGMLSPDAITKAMETLKGTFSSVKAELAALAAGVNAPAGTSKNPKDITELGTIADVLIAEGKGGVASALGGDQKKAIIAAAAGRGEPFEDNEYVTIFGEKYRYDLKKNDLIRSKNAQGLWMGGSVKGYHMGGLMGGMGTATSDSNYIRASKGEFMQSARAVNYYGVANMERLNRRQVDPRVFENMREAGERNENGVTVSIGAINITEPGCSSDEIIATIEKKLGAVMKRTTDNRVMKV
jgi:TP901 family phage tail tape measure protein